MVMNDFARDMFHSFITNMKEGLRIYCRHRESCSDCLFIDGCNGGDMIKTVNFFCDKILEGFY